MLKITEEYINSTAPNQNAIMNGWGLVKKNSFVSLHISPDVTVIFGECIGSGASNYVISADFINPEAPVFRCSCPSRQFPCKHALGLMYAYVSGKEFSIEDIPGDILEKRGKAEKREEKKKTKTKEEPKNVNKNALIKKINAQMEGLELLEKVIYSIAQSGLGTVNRKTLHILEDQAKQLGNYYIQGAQTALRDFIVLFQDTDDAEMIYTEAVDCLNRIYSLCKKGREYLEGRLADPDRSLDGSSTLEEWLGHAWQLSELKDLGLVENDVELVQISFTTWMDEARREFVDAGTWLNLKTGQVQETRNYRPYKAAKYIREDDSINSVVQVKELFVYPGNMNPRVRWNNMTLRELTSVDYHLIKSYAYKSYPEIIKLVKNQIKNPLAAKYPLALLHFARIGMVDDKYVMEDSAGQRIVLADHPGGFEPPNIKMMQLLNRENLHGQVALVRFHHQMETRRLFAQPLSIVQDDRIIRLV